MDLKDIAAVSGKGGLFRILKPTRTGVILETIDESKMKLIANANSRVSILKEISVYTTSKEASLPLEDVFLSIYSKFGKELNVTPKSEEQDLRSFLSSVVPDYDREKVYNSDIKKIVSWYSILVQHFPGIFEKKDEPASKAEKEEAGSPVKEAKKETKSAKEKEEAGEKKASKKDPEEKPKAKAKAAAKKK